MEDKHSLQKLLDFQLGLIKHKEMQAWMEHLTALHVSQKRQPPSQGITSSVGARLIDAQGCTSHPGAGKAQRLNLTTQTRRFLFQILSCSKRQHAAVPLPEKQEATAKLSTVYNKIIIFFQ